MPRLVLFEDDGRELMASDVSREVCDWLARALMVHGGSVRTVAAAIRIGRALLSAAAPPAPPPRRVAAGGKRGGRA